MDVEREELRLAYGCMYDDMYDCKQLSFQLAHKDKRLRRWPAKPIGSPRVGSKSHRCRFSVGIFRSPWLGEVSGEIRGRSIEH